MADNPKADKVLVDIEKLAAIKTAPHAIGMLSSFIERPLGITLSDQDNEEEIIIFMRQHGIVNIPWIILTLLLIIFPFFIVPLFAPLFTLSIFNSPLLGTILLSFYYIIVFGFALTSFITWYFNVGLVTNERLVDIDFFNILLRVISEARLDDIRDVTVTVAGTLGTFVDFGDILAQTEATQENIEFDRIPHPQQVATVINEIIDQIRESEGGGA